MYFKVPANSLQTNETGGTKKMRRELLKAKLQKDNGPLTDFTSLYGSREEWVSGWRGPGDWFVSEYQV